MILSVALLLNPGPVSIWSIIIEILPGKTYQYTWLAIISNLLLSK